MPISTAEVKKIAELARLELTPEEERRHAETISAVLEYMKILNEVDSEGVVPTYHVTGLQNVYREDEPKECLLRDKLIAALPAVEQEELVVPEVFE